jgi:peroxiredoxin
LKAVLDFSDHCSYTILPNPLILVHFKNNKEIMTKAFLFFSFLLLTFHPIIAQNPITIKGTISNNTVYTSVYLENMMNQKDLDSGLIDKSGLFSLVTTIDKADFFKLRFSQEHYILLVLNPGETVDIEVDANNFFQPVIKGSKNSEMVYGAYGRLKEFDLEMQQMNKQFEKKKKDFIREFILNNLNSLSCLYFIDVISIEDEPEIYRKLEQSLYALYPDHPLVGNLRERVKNFAFLSIGSLAPEIDLPGIDGKNIKLSSLRGKYVLIDFWAAWCGPCRKESPHLVATYKEFNQKGFEIYSVSLDNNKKDWEAAIKKDGLGAWSHVSDLKYWNSAAAGDYGVDAIPFTILIDREGKILAKGLRGDELKRTLKELLN